MFEFIWFNGSGYYVGDANILIYCPCTFDLH